MRLFIAAATTLMLAASGLSAPAEEKSKEAKPQAQISGDAWRKNPPTLPPPRPFKLPKIENIKLSNGLNVDLVEDHRFPFITATLGLKIGTAYDPPSLSGVTKLTAEMLTEGTKTRSSKQIADEIDFIGGKLGTATDPDFTVISSSALSKYKDRLIDILSDAILNPTFPESELDLKKTNLIQELAMKRSDPNWLVEERFHKVVFGEHPYATIAPTQASVSRITRKDLETFHQSNYVPNEATLVVVGDFDANGMKALLEKKFASQWKANPVKKLIAGTLPVPRAPHIYLVDRPGSVQSTIKLGNVAIKRSDPDFYRMLVANQVLGGAANARLFLNLREQKSFTYGAYSALFARQQPGWFGASAAVRSEVTAPSLQELLYELQRMRNLKVTEKELTNAKKYLVGSFQLGVETQGGLAQRLLESQLYGLPKDYLEKYTDNVMAVTVDDVQRVARKYMDVDHIAITVVGDAKQIKSELENFGPVEVYDTAGKLSSEAKAPHPGS
ncbi:MAG TPA: pitrilysin family protein [Candidatus Obscuribacterales bacterium]